MFLWENASFFQKKMWSLQHIVPPMLRLRGNVWRCGRAQDPPLQCAQKGVKRGCSQQVSDHITSFPNYQFSILATLIFVATRQSSSKLGSALAAPKINFTDRVSNLLYRLLIKDPTPAPPLEGRGYAHRPLAHDDAEKLHPLKLHREQGGQFSIFNLQFSILATLIFVATRQSTSKLGSALAAPKIQSSIFNFQLY